MGTDTDGPMTDADTDPVALVTGASRGIGAATASRLAEEGYDLVLAARTESDLREVAERVSDDSGVETRVVPTDVTDPDAVQSLVDVTLERFDRLDVAVVNAGTGERRNRPIDEIPLEEYRAVRSTNVDGTFYTARAALDPLRESAGTLVFVGSFKAKYPSTSTPVYAASKWWLRGFAHSLAGRVGPDGVAVTLVNPSGVPTEFARERRERTNAERLDPDEEITAEDVADAIVTAARQDAPAAVTELDLFRRDIYERF
ncbi:SDR family oxidoreductase [Natranaeroarchaeum sulfidigenes]|uniref:NADP-dependent 3-hydroxy acid dehydrogenase YdfG n=1 Tax=Natranaeroarchaeum sulfidigenes TaxID=2784880 RepID=A0A897MU35_9EURY|nr:SDR family oxidoreductase [Natranaeroarchaeum sulfidigenes]QSG02553.1 NADP-dependent 3-hydroxy acid dehydrogenase YdfG [Natranaeroarchaeum sulfidigenes]